VDRIENYKSLFPEISSTFFFFLFYFSKLKLSFIDFIMAKFIKE
jgi:hypothetical protein